MNQFTTSPIQGPGVPDDDFELVPLAKLTKAEITKQVKHKGSRRNRVPGRRIKEIEDPDVAKKLSRFSSAPAVRQKGAVREKLRPVNRLRGRVRGKTTTTCKPAAADMVGDVSADNSDVEKATMVEETPRGRVRQPPSLASVVRHRFRGAERGQAPAGIRSSTRPAVTSIRQQRIRIRGKRPSTENTVVKEESDVEEEEITPRPSRRFRPRHGGKTKTRGRTEGIERTGVRTETTERRALGEKTESREKTSFSRRPESLTRTVGQEDTQEEERIEGQQRTKSVRGRFNPTRRGSLTRKVNQEETQDEERTEGQKKSESIRDRFTPTRRGSVVSKGRHSVGGRPTTSATPETTTTTPPPTTITTEKVTISPNAHHISYTLEDVQEQEDSSEDVIVELEFPDYLELEEDEQVELPVAEELRSSVPVPADVFSQATHHLMKNKKMLPVKSSFLPTLLPQRTTLSARTTLRARQTPTVASTDIETDTTVVPEEAITEQEVIKEFVADVKAKERRNKFEQRKEKLKERKDKLVEVEEPRTESAEAVTSLPAPAKRGRFILAIGAAG